MKFGNFLESIFCQQLLNSLVHSLFTTAGQKMIVIFVAGCTPAPTTVEKVHIIFIHIIFLLWGPGGPHNAGRRLPTPALINVRIWEFVCTHVTHYNYDYLPHAQQILFLSYQFIFKYRLNLPFHAVFAFFSVKLPNVIQRLVSQENAFKKIKNPSPLSF